MNKKSLLPLFAFAMLAPTAGAHGDTAPLLQHATAPSLLTSDSGDDTGRRDRRPMRKPGKVSTDMGAYLSDTIRLITDTPAGDLRIYQRTGQQVIGTDGDNDTMIMSESEQSSHVSIVYGDNGNVWIKNPVSAELRETWVPGHISADGKTITVPMFKFIDYMPSLDFGRQMCVCTWNEEQQMYLPDMSVKEVTYTLDGDRITLEGMSKERLLSSAFRAKGETEEEYHYDGTWAERGDYGSVYTLLATQPNAFPADAEAETWSLGGTAMSFSWSYVKNEARLAFEGDEIYMSGIADTDTSWCIKGYRSGTELHFPSGQFLGTSHDNPYYFCADPTGGNPEEVIFTLTEEGLYHCLANVYIACDAQCGSYYWYYDGMRLTDKPLPPLNIMPEGKANLFEMAYKGYIQSIDFYYDSTNNVDVAIDGDNIYIGGIYYAPEGVIKGRIDNGKAIFEANQFLGAGSSSVPETWFIPFDPDTRQPVDALVMDFNRADYSLSNPSAAISISTIDHRNVGLFWYFEPTFTPLDVREADPQMPQNVTLGTSPYDSDLYLDFIIPVKDTDGEELIENYLGYTIMLRTAEGETVYPLTHAHSSKIEEGEPMETVPYNLMGEGISWTMGYHSVRLIGLPEGVSEVGVRSVYSGGDTPHMSETVWVSAEGVGAPMVTPDEEDSVIYDLMGRRVSGIPSPGIYIVGGRKTVVR